jgi:hypothetical protein
MQLHEGRPVLSVPTDTAVPMRPVPVFYLHTSEHAFCARPGCFCHQFADELRGLLLAVITGEVYLRPQLNGAIRWEATDGPT